MSARTAVGSSDSFRQSLLAGPSPALSLSLSSRFLAAPRPRDLAFSLISSALADGRIKTFFLPPPGDGGLEPIAGLAAEVSRRGGNTVATLCCAGRSREEILSSVAALREAGVGSFLAVTGDMPAGAKPRTYRSLFDIDSVRLLMLRGEWAGGEESFAGCAVSPFKALEAEVYWQYEKLRRKVETGARFFVTQPGFDLDRYGEPLRFCRREGLDLPAVAGLVVPDGDMADRLESGAVPGVRLPADLAAEVRQESRDGEAGRKRGHRRVAAMMRSLRGLGYAGLLLDGDFRNYDEIGTLLDDYEAPRAADMQSQPRSHFPLGGFSYFRKDREGALSNEPAPLAPARRQHPLYILGHLIDLFAFKKASIISRFLESLCRFCDRGPMRTRALWLFEFQAKAPLYGCRMCGDCALYACGFICYVHRCPKKLLNGPCGGSIDGWCEVHPGRKRCLWVDVHRRLKVLAARPSFPAAAIPPGNRDLYGTCSWINFFLGRDHQQRGRRGG